jgi:nitrous oxidase accessory protein NosD
MCRNGGIGMQLNEQADLHYKLFQAMIEPSDFMVFCYDTSQKIMTANSLLNETFGIPKYDTGEL